MTYQPESEECLNSLVEALALLRRAARELAAAPDADLLTKNAIAGQITEIEDQLNNLTRRLDELPTWRPTAG